MLLTKQAIKAVTKDREIKKVPVPEWAPDNATDAERAEAHVFVRSMLGKERDLWEQWFTENGKKQAGLFRATFAVRTVCDSQGDLIFTPDDVRWLCEKSAAALQRIYRMGLKLSAISAEDEEELEKNFERGAGSISSSDSPSTSAGPSS